MALRFAVYIQPRGGVSGWDPGTDDPGLEDDMPDALCQVLVADPPWPFDDPLPGAGRGAVKKYDLLSLEQIKAFPLPPSDPSWGVLFLWRVASQIEEACAVARVWGYAPKSELVWRKLRRCTPCAGTGMVLAGRGRARALAPCAGCGGRGFLRQMGMGRIVRASHETCLIATRGRPPAPADRGVRSEFDAIMPVDDDGRRIHSAKPDAFYGLVEKLYPDAVRDELFARWPRPGWRCHGLEAPTVAACRGTGRRVTDQGDPIPCPGCVDCTDA